MWAMKMMMGSMGEALCCEEDGGGSAQALVGSARASRRGDGDFF